MKYALIKSTNRQILLVENNTREGLERIENLVGEGCKYVGTIDSDYSVGQLVAGFNKDNELTIRELQGTFRKIRDLI